MPYRTALVILAAATALGACSGQDAEGRASPEGAATGELPGPISPFSDVAAIGNLAPELRRALRQATRDAADDGIEITVTSGWRTAEYQETLLEEAVRKYGSRQEALRWVDAPDRSTHVTGDAVDVGPTDAASWMDQHGARYGLCRIYANEMWHYELATGPGGECPAMRMDATA